MLGTAAGLSNNCMAGYFTITKTAFVFLACIAISISNTARIRAGQTTSQKQNKAKTFAYEIYSWLHGRYLYRKLKHCRGR